jgi:hypothetical protein
MNKTNWNEEQLLSWRPRRASSGLKPRIFAAEHPAHTARWFWGALVPATACALLTLMTINRGGDGFNGGAQMGMALSNLNYSPLAPEQRQSAQNHNDFVTFDSTNKSVFNSNVRFTLATNFSNE